MVKREEKFRDIIFTKDGTVKTPDGREFSELHYALKAYNLTHDDFFHRLEAGGTLREAFCGMDYKCGLKFGADCKVRDHKGLAFNSLVEMCIYHNADIAWFETLLELTGDLEIALVQKDVHKNELFVKECKMQKEKLEHERKIQEMKDEQERKEKEAFKLRLSRAKRVLDKYVEFHVESYKCFNEERAYQIKNLAEFLMDNSRLTYDEKRLYNKVMIAIDCHTLIKNTKPDPNKALVDSILLDYPKERIKRLKEKKKEESKKGDGGDKDSSNAKKSGGLSKADNCLNKIDGSITTGKVKKSETQLTEEEIAKREEIRAKRVLAGKISAAKRREKKLLASDNGLFLVEVEKPSKEYSEIESESINILQSYLGSKLTAF